MSDELERYVDEENNIFWYKGELLHREDGPAIEYSDGTKEWYINNELHNDNGPALISDRGKEWYKNGKRHREDGPAIDDACGDQYWFFEGKHHRLDGPAVDFAFTDYKEWWYHGEHINCSSQEEFERLIKLKAFW